MFFLFFFNSHCFVFFFFFVSVPYSVQSLICPTLVGHSLGNRIEFRMFVFAVEPNFTSGWGFNPIGNDWHRVTEVTMSFLLQNRVYCRFYLSSGNTEMQEPVDFFSCIACIFALIKAFTIPEGGKPQGPLWGGSLKLITVQVDQKWRTHQWYFIIHYFNTSGHWFLEKCIIFIFGSFIRNIDRFSCNDS